LFSHFGWAKITKKYSILQTNEVIQIVFQEKYKCYIYTINMWNLFELKNQINENPNQ